MDLLPCPYCASTARLAGGGGPWLDPDGKVCHETFAVCNNDQCQASGPYLASDEQAAAAWNSVARIVMAPKGHQADTFIRPIIRHGANGAYTVTIQESADGHTWPSDKPTTWQRIRRWFGA